MSDGTNQGAARRAVLFELESVAFQGRAVVYKVLKHMLAEKGVDLSVTQFAKHCLNAPLQILPARLARCLEQPALKEEAFASKTVSEIEKALIDEALVADTGLVPLIQAAEEQRMAVGFLSGLTADTARKMVDKLGVDSTDMVLHARSEEARHEVGVDGWLKLAKLMGVTAAGCLAFASSSAACKSALAAGMSCVAVPDQYTGFQDFGGADMVYESLSSVDLDEVYSLSKASL